MTWLPSLLFAYYKDSITRPAGTCKHVKINYIHTIKIVQSYNVHASMLTYYMLACII
nr:MAG TPA: hypothetical protein [Caudoviricetes sp.]DAS93238.1 MAG TPA: hypothetical protein [Caudoviricetes sp.]